MKNLFFLSLLFSVSFLSFPIAQIFWEPSNGPEGGFVRCLTVDELGTLFAGFSTGGAYGYEHQGRAFYKSENDGLSWQLLGPRHPDPG